MQLLLRKDVGMVGKAGETVDVANGYGRNYLLPRGLAVTVTPDNMKMIHREQEKVRAEADAQRAALGDVAKKLETVSATVPAKANEEGKLFGSVTRENVAESLRQEGVDIPPESIACAEEGREFPLKEVGVFLLNITLDEGIEANTKLWVVQE